MKAKQIKILSNIFYILGIICAILLFTHNTHGFFTAIRIGFYVFGGAGLVLSLLQFTFITEDKWEDFNLLFWIGSLVVFIGFVAKTTHLKYATHILIVGLAITGISYFVNPFKKDKTDEDELLDN
ncbi:hypothetical protein [Fluviicola taffensis]|uniref:Uncharacterized protein n=1 Tax=Fluviicola taffensis (strain DSM 16823 / NCIMB 13979 / RW262) TaxID=755732 RepID=F2II14_FLUTR|nr:hypothetical protein [Fluviicola taffensis]AEA42714.1 hypothetical protein Fluta_0710 [Fluviicola taffensis DSM 16823]